jgi:hypothetical protein
MSHTRTSAKKLLNASELALFDAGRRDEIGSLDERTLKSKIERTRRLRDKYRDLARRQHLATRSRTGTKRGPRGDANFRTAEKDVLFTELLGRFEARLAQRQGTAKRAKPIAKSSAGKSSAGKSSADKSAAPRKSAQRTALGEDERSPKAPAKQVAAPGRAAKNATGFMSARAKGLDTERQRHKSRGTAIQAHLSSRGRRSQAKRDQRR